MMMKVLTILTLVCSTAAIGQMLPEGPVPMVSACVSIAPHLPTTTVMVVCKLLVAAWMWILTRRRWHQELLGRI